MPDPVMYLRTMCAALSASAIIALALGWTRPPASSVRINAASIAGLCLALLLGYAVSGLRVAWPPTNGLGRWLLIVFPSVITIELIAAQPRVPRRVAWLLRAILSASLGRILIHDSIYLGGPHSQWTAWRTALVLTFSGSLLAGEWGLLSWLSRRSPGPTVPLALAMSIQCGGIAVMLAGYIAGGAAAIPLAAALVGTSLASGLIARRHDLQGAIGIGTTGLFALLFIGRFFGALSTTSALALFLAPLACWITELPVLRNRNPWLVGSFRLALVSIPLLIVLVLAKIHFDREMRPLL